MLNQNIGFTKLFFLNLRRKKINWQEGLFILLRLLSCPFASVVDVIPKKGRVLDLGCGHGILSLSLSFRYPKLKVFGIDPDKKKIAWTKKVKPDNLEVFCGIVDSKFTKRFGDFFDTIVVIDVFYLLPDKEKLKLLKQLKKLLKQKRSTRLVLKASGKGSHPIYWWLKFQEKIMQRFLGLTHSKYKRSFFTPPNKYQELLKKAGFRVFKTKRVYSILPYPHFLLVAGHSNFSKKLRS